METEKKFRMEAKIKWNDIAKRLSECSDEIGWTFFSEGIQKWNVETNTPERNIVAEIPLISNTPNHWIDFTLEFQMFMRMEPNDSTPDYERVNWLMDEWRNWYEALLHSDYFVPKGKMENITGKFHPLSSGLWNGFAWKATINLRYFPCGI